MGESKLDSVGTPVKRIEVQFSVRSIQLFSEGLYSSPHKAIEELVSNSYDAGATNVHVVLRDANHASGSILVLDDGVGMDADAIQKHWLIGKSDKRDETYIPPRGRAPIGKFGIGKLATYVLASKFHIVSKAKGKYWIATMDFSAMIKSAEATKSDTEQREYQFWVRSMTASEARGALAQEYAGTGEGYDAIRLFGPDAARTWTLAILSELRPLSAQLKVGTTKNVLSSALPLRSDFKIFLDGIRVESSKLERPTLGTWRLGATFTPDIAGVIAYHDPKATEPEERVGIHHPTLGRIHGSFTLFEDPIAEGKSDRFSRSHGFFVYVRGRLINAESAYFGLSENTLRHGTFSRFRMDVHIDALDEELRSSRENYKETPNVEAARDILHACFNVARQRHHDSETNESAGKRRIVDRIASAPRSVTSTPMLSMLQRMVDRQITPRLSRINAPGREPSDILGEIRSRAAENKLFTDVDVTVDFAADDGVCTYEAASGHLEINTSHPFIAHFIDDPDSKRNRNILELLATSEVLLEASLYENLGDEATVHDILEQRDRLLRSLARSTDSRSPGAIAVRLLDASSGWKEFEIALVDAFTAMGFDARHLGGKNKPDGIARAYITARSGGERRAFSVSLEAKQYQENVSKDDAKPSTIARHRNKFDCDHAIVVARAFTEGEEAALTIEVRDQNAADQLRFEKLSPTDKKRYSQPRTITLARVDDIAALVRLLAYKRLGLSQLRELFSGTTPDEVALYVETLRSSAPDQRYFREILDAVVDLHKAKPNILVEYSLVEMELLREYKVDMTSDEIKHACFAMEQLSNGLIRAAERHVELDSSIEKIVAAISRAINELPERDRPAARAALKIDDAGSAKRAGKGAARSRRVLHDQTSRRSTRKPKERP